MDDPNLDPSRHSQALVGLARLNKVSGAANSLWAEIAKVARKNLNNGGNPSNPSNPSSPIQVLEIASGGCDVLLELAQRSKASGLNIQFTGSDLSSTAIKLGKEKLAKDCPEVQILSIDAMLDSFPSGFDIVMTSLFTHHLNPEQVVMLLRKMNSVASKCVLVSDLERSSLNLLLVWIATRALTRSDVVHFDGPVSVKAAYTAAEFLALAEQAGLKAAKTARVFPCRFLFSCSK